ncbi:MAG: hypothetical protein P1U85_06980 [Verrucomicrobiales bacterium]|nr:hypothetical protein [Verrucomicrobiales bacterium]
MPPRILFVLLLTQLVSTAGMFGVIWQVQLITYPQFASIDPVSFPEFHLQYCQRITWIVGPLMLLELASTSLSTLALWNTRWRMGSLACLVIVGTLWLITALVQVPQHEVLSFGFDPAVAEALVLGNGWRVAGWTLHLAVVSGIIFTWCRSRMPTIFESENSTLTSQENSDC